MAQNQCFHRNRVVKKFGPRLLHIMAHGTCPISFPFDIAPPSFREGQMVSYFFTGGARRGTLVILVHFCHFREIWDDFLFSLKFLIFLVYIYNRYQHTSTTTHAKRALAGVPGLGRQPSLGFTSLRPGHNQHAKHVPDVRCCVPWRRGCRALGGHLHRTSPA